MIVATKRRKRSDPEVIDRIARQLEPAARAAFLDAIEAIRDEVGLAELERAIQTGLISEVERALDIEDLPRRMEAFRDVILEGFRKAGLSAATTAVAAGLEIRFDLLNPRAVTFLRLHGAELVREVSEHTRAGIRRVVIDGFRDGFAPPTMARLIKRRIGLTEFQAQTVRNYETALRSAVAGETGFDALASRFALNPVRGPGGLVESRVRSAVEQYEKRLLRLRSDTIARTETLRAANAGQQELWQQLRDTGAVSVDQEREWVTAEDERVCPICEPLDGERAVLGMRYIGGLDHPPAHPNCRCAEVMVFS